MLLAGHSHLEAAKLLGLEKMPAITLHGLSEAQKRVLLIADNKIANNAGWDFERLARSPRTRRASHCGKPRHLLHHQIFGPAEIDQLISDFEDDTADPADDIQTDWLLPPVDAGYLWQLGSHRLLCGDAREPANLDRLLGDEHAAMGIPDPPYNVRVRSVVGRGQI